MFDILFEMELAVDLNSVDLAALESRVGPLALAGERTLPVGEMFVDLFAEGALVRGRTIVCDGAAATSVALALVAPAIAEGGWLAMIDVPTVGLDAASEFGVPLERVVAVTSGEATGNTGNTADDRWADIVAAAADGFDVLLARVPHDVSATVLRKIATRIRQRGAVMVVLGDPGSMVCDGRLCARSSHWSGLGDGHGYLRHRQLVVEASGRRLPGGRSCSMSLPGDPVVASIADRRGSVG